VDRIATARNIDAARNCDRAKTIAKAEAFVKSKDLRRQLRKSKRKCKL